MLIWQGDQGDQHIITDYCTQICGKYLDWRANTSNSEKQLSGSAKCLMNVKLVCNICLIKEVSF